MCLHYSRQTVVHIIYSLSKSCKTDSGPVSIPPSALGLCFVFDCRDVGSLFPCTVPQTVCSDVADTHCKVPFNCKQLHKRATSFPVDISATMLVCVCTLLAHKTIKTVELPVLIHFANRHTPLLIVRKGQGCIWKARWGWTFPPPSASRFLWKPVLNTTDV